jgi:hypothetical protein
MLSTTQGEKRKHERTPAPMVGLFQVYKYARLGTGPCFGASLLRDISQGGVSINMDRAIPVGELVKLENRTVCYTARVRSCTRTDLGYKMGLQFIRR